MVEDDASGDSHETPRTPVAISGAGRQYLSGQANAPALRVATFNIQVGIGSRRLRHMLTHSLRYVLPHQQVLSNLDLIAAQLHEFDIVALQETDSGSFRNHQIHQAQYIASRAGMPYCYTQITRDIGRIASISLGLLCRRPCTKLVRHRLPASRHGRGLMEAVFRIGGRDIAVFVTHLSLRKTNRMRQIRFLVPHLNRYADALLMGDLNCEPGSPEFNYLLMHTTLEDMSGRPCTFPSWHPKRRLDHILITDKLAVEDLHTMPFICSDHLPVVAEIHIRKK